MLDERFWSKVSRVSLNGCWEWTANKNNQGYGLYRPGGTAPKRLAHRLSYADRNGDIPKGMLVLHKCDNPLCVNPDHLVLGTFRDNTQDMVAKGRHRYKPSGIAPPTLIGVANPKAKLTEEIVRKLRSEMAAGKAVRAIARELSMDAATIRDIRNRKTWRHVD